MQVHTNGERQPETAGRRPGRGWIGALVVAVAVLAALATTPGAVTAAQPICTPNALPPGTSGCLPTPQECATGNFNGHWEGGFPGRVADCLGGAGHVIHYEGGYSGADGKHAICGTYIENDQVTVVGTGWRDTNICPPASSPPGYGVKGRAFEPAVQSKRGVVASVSPEASRVGVDILDAGGNAIDAAVATVFAVGVTRPAMCGIGGGGFLVYDGRKGTAALDFRETAPAALTPEKLWVDGINREGSGHVVVGVPGVVAGMDAALRGYGTMTLAEVIAPAERLARAGIPVSTGFSTDYTHTGGTLVNDHRLRLFPAAAAVYLRGGLQYPPDNHLADSTLVQTDYANSLALIARHGADAFYKGSIAAQIVADMEASEASSYPGDQGVMTAEDLASYQAIWREPLIGSYRGRHIVAMPPPTAGGIVTLETLNILEGYPLGRTIAHSSADHLHLLAEAHKIAWADRTAYVADPKFTDVPATVLTSKKYAAARRAEIDPNQAQDYAPGTISGSAGQTTHVSVIDRHGDAVAVTCSMNWGFGSAVVAPGTGFLLNNHMLDFEEDAASVNAAEGGKRPRSSMSPTIVLEHGEPVLVTGAAGGTYIPMGVISSISNVVDYGMDVAGAVDAARVFSFDCCAMELEDGRVPPADQAELVARGHDAIVSVGEYNLAPLVQAVGTNLRTGRRLAASDPREDRGAVGQR